MRSTRGTLAGLGAASTLILAGCGGGSGSAGQMATATATTTVALADLNGDGTLDLVSDTYYRTTDTGSSLGGGMTLAIQPPNQPGNFQPTSFPYAPNPSALAVAKLSPAGNPGIVVAAYGLAYPWPPDYTPKNGGVSVLWPNPAQPGGFLSPTWLYSGTYVPTGVAVADLDGDTYPDIVVAGADAGTQAGQATGTLMLFYQQAPGGTFGAPMSLAVGGPATAVAIADLNGDGLPDLAVTTANGLVSVLLQNPDHTFQAHVDYSVGPDPVSLAVADLNGDGLPDIAVANHGSASASTTQGLSLLFQNPAPAEKGTFAPAATLDAGDSFSTCVAIGDLNGDGKPDIVLANSGQAGLPGSLSVFLQSATAPGTFAAPVLYPGVNGPTSVAIGDMPGDGLPYLAIGDGGGAYLRFQLPAGGGNFGPAVSLISYTY